MFSIHAKYILYFTLTCPFLGCFAWGAPPDFYATQLAFDKTNLKNIHIRYRVVYNSSKNEISPLMRETLLVYDSGKYFIRQLDSYRECLSYLDGNEVKTTNFSPSANYYWFDGTYITEGSDEPTVSWVITPGANQDCLECHDPLNSELGKYFMLIDKPDGQVRLLEQKIVGDETVCVYQSPSTKRTVAYAYSEKDGNNVAPLKIHARTSFGIDLTSEWSGWKKYDSVWIPQHARIQSVIRKDVDGDVKYEVQTDEFSLLEVLSINDHVCPKWFMPQFPARNLLIKDKSVEPPRNIRNFGENGQEYY